VESVIEHKDAVAVTLDENSVLTKVSAHDIDPNTKGVKVVFCIRNEKFRLPFFFEYYRNLGVKEFFAVDNNSDDDTLEYLLQQPDVHVFRTEASYKDSNAGRDWTTELANLYCDGNWLLTLDVDEFFVYPDIEKFDLNYFTKALERWKYQGVFSIFLDFYSKKNLSQTKYLEGKNPFELCDYFDSSESYTTYETENFPYFQIKGGIRQRVFWDADNPRSGPSMRKIVLVKWNANKFEYLHSTHSCLPIRLADVTGVVAHFKFLDHIKEFSAKEVSRNDRVNGSSDWKVYANKLSAEDVMFYDPNISVEYKNSESLVQDGHMVRSLKIYDFCCLRYTGDSGYNDAFNTERVRVRELLKEEILKGRSSSYQAFTRSWPTIALFNGATGASKASMSLFSSSLKIEDDVQTLMTSRLWRLSYYFRKISYKLGFSSKRALIEEDANTNLYQTFLFTYKSIWWDLLALVRIPFKVVRKILSYLR